MSIGKLTVGAKSEQYYTRDVASGREDYYTGNDEAPGRWAGSGWGLAAGDRPVTESELGNLLTGHDPKTGDELRAMNEHSVAGFDLTFRAPKSVSLLFAIGDRELVSQVIAAHEAAVADALGYLERTACKTRRMRRGASFTLDGDGFVGAVFRHRTSRAGDPLLHSHVVVGNLTHADGRWSALDGRLLYRQAKPAGYLYQAALRAQLVCRLGVQFGPVENGVADIAGIPRSAIVEFSRRRVEILEHMHARGERSARAAQIATLETRRAKTYDVPMDRPRELWRARAAEHGVTAHDLGLLLGRAAPDESPATTLARRAGHLAGPYGITRDASTFDRRDVVQAWAEAHREGASVECIEHLTDAWLSSANAIRLRAVRGAAEPTFTTPEMLDTERRLLDAADRGRDQHRGVALERDVDRAIERRPSLTREQAEMVRRLTRSGRGIDVVRAAAGTGKTFALDAAREAWEATGRRVIGCSTAARAAAELAEQTAMPTTTIARLITELEHGYALAEGSVLVVDEAGMVGTRSLAKLAEHAEAANAKLVLVGDDRQLPEIRAGGAFRALADRTEAITLREVRRQAHDWDRQALDDLRHGRIDDWHDAYAEHDRIRRAPDAERTRRQLVDDWHAHGRDHPEQDSLMIAHHRDDVADLNRRARDKLQLSDALDTDRMTIDGRGFAIGDAIVTTRNDRRLGVTNGTRAEITAIDPDTREVTIATRDGRAVRLSSTYLEAGHIEHGYAMTAHRAQGATVDHSFVLGSDDLYREWGYTALTRHRDTATFYVNVGDAREQLPGLRDRDRDQTGPGDVTAALARSQRKTLATERGVPEVAPRAAASPMDRGR